MKRKRWAIFIVLIIFLIPLLIVNCCYKINLDVPFLKSEWGPGDLLSYISSCISLGATCILGVLTYRLSKSANDMNSRLLQIERNREKIEHNSRIGIISFKAIIFKFWKDSHETNMEDYDTIMIVFGGKCTGNEVIKRIVRSEIKLNVVAPKDNLKNKSFSLERQFFYKNTDNKLLAVNILENTFSDVIVISQFDKDNFAFNTLKDYISKRVEYSIEVDLSFENILDEKRHEVIKVDIVGKVSGKNEIIKLENK